MSYKNAMANLAFGGGKAVIIADAKRPKTPELFEAYGRFVNSLGGRYITAEDVGTKMCIRDSDGDTRARRMCALDGARAAQRFVVGMWRDHEEHVSCAEAAEVLRGCPNVRRAHERSEQQSAARASQPCVYRCLLYTSRCV